MNKKRQCILNILTFVLMFVVSFSSAYALTASEVFEKGVAKIRNTSSLSANFTMLVNGQNLSGRIVSKGKKFAITSNGVSNWYNGKDLYTYNPSSGDVTVFNPTSSELTEINPLLYLNSSSLYTVKEAKSSKKGVVSVILTPKKKSAGIKSVTVEMDSKTYLPVTMTVVPSSGSAVKLNVSGIQLNGSVADSQFEFPKSKYPKAKLIDMR